jgi:branched-chain amino acid transport system permease protein
MPDSHGLSLQYGVAGYLTPPWRVYHAGGTTCLYTVFHINPLLSAVISGPIVFIIGFGLHRTLFRYLKEKSASAAAFEGNSMLATFGLLFIIQTVALIIWTSQIHGYSYLNNPIIIFGAQFGANRLVTLGFSIAIGVIFYLFLARTRLGKAIRAAAQEKSR